MEMVNEMYRYKEGDINPGLYGAAVKTLIILLAPFVPHVTEEMWEHLGYGGSVHDQKRPEYDEKALVKDTIEIVVQINGRIKEKINIAGDSSKEEMEKIAVENDKIKALTEGKNIVKIIAVPNKLINIVVKQRRPVISTAGKDIYERTEQYYVHETAQNSRFRKQKDKQRQNCRPRQRNEN